MKRDLITHFPPHPWCVEKTHKQQCTFKGRKLLQLTVLAEVKARGALAALFLDNLWSTWVLDFVELSWRWSAVARTLAGCLLLRLYKQRQSKRQYSWEVYASNHQYSCNASEKETYLNSSIVYVTNLIYAPCKKFFILVPTLKCIVFILHYHAHDITKAKVCSASSVQSVYFLCNIGHGFVRTTPAI